MLASEYGWDLQDILEKVYVDTLFLFVKAIERRKLDEHRIQLALISNPHTKDPQHLWRMLKPPVDVSEKPTKLDITSFDILKNKISQGSHIVVKT